MKKVILTLAILLALTSTVAPSSWYWKTAESTKGACVAIEWENRRGDIAREIDCLEGDSWKAIYTVDGKTAFNLAGQVAFYR